MRSGKIVALPVELERLFRRVRWRMRLSRALEDGARWSLLAAVLTVVAVVGWRTLGTRVVWLAVPLLALLLVAVVAATRPILLLHVAKRIDDTHGLSDRMTNALWFCTDPARPPPNPWFEAIVGDAQGKIANVSAKRAVPF